MKLEDYERTRKELNTLLNDINKKININYERARMSNVNQFEYKLVNTFMLSMLPYLGLVLTTVGIISAQGVGAITDIIPALYVPATILGTSFGIGLIANNLLDKKYNVKERISSFSKAKTEAQKLEEQIHYEIELEKATNRKLAIEQTLEILNSNESMLKSLSDKYNITQKEESVSQEQLEKRITELSKLLNEKLSELDLLTTQKVLSDKFWRIRLKGGKVTETLTAATLAGVMSMLYTLVPLFPLIDAIEYSSNLGSLLTVLSPFTTGALVTTGYWIKKIKDQTKTFNDLNDSLGELSLPNTNDDVREECEQLQEKIGKKINDICAVIIQIQEEKRTLEHLDKKETDKENTRIKSKIELDRSNDNVLSEIANLPYIVPLAESDKNQHNKPYTRKRIRRKNRRIDNKDKE